MKILGILLMVISCLVANALFNNGTIQTVAVLFGTFAVFGAGALMVSGGNE